MQIMSRCAHATAHQVTVITLWTSAKFTASISECIISIIRVSAAKNAGQ